MKKHPAERTEFANRLRKVRRDLDLTQQEFAEMTGIPRPTLVHWEAGNRPPNAVARAFLTLFEQDPDININILYSIILAGKE